MMRRLPDFYKRRRLTERGYFGYPLTDADLDVPERERWLAFDIILEKAKHGHFNAVPELFPLAVRSNDWVLVGECARLLGNACAARDLRPVLDMFATPVANLSEITYAQTLENWGHLAVVPTLIDVYARNSGSDDAMYVAMGLSRLLEETPGDIDAFPEEQSDVREYCEMVRARYDELCEKLGTRDAVVFRGGVIGARRICDALLSDLAEKHRFHEMMRHKFEAYTGIDCSTFYVDDVLQPLAVAATVEEFLDGGGADRLVDGSRYFFAHHIPD